ncbi:putative membrane protein [Clostridium sp. CAG:510]|nr:putative membrane protein [Clostridium sp. CAG:510]
MLAVKAVLDFVIVVVFVATYGIGTACSAIAIFVYQGLITLAAHLIGNFVPDSLISDLSYVGSCLIFCVGINLTFGKKIKVGNLLPALLGPVVYAVFQAL